MNRYFVTATIEVEAVDKDEAETMVEDIFETSLDVIDFTVESVTDGSGT